MKFIKWLDSADVFKNKGLYVDRMHKGREITKTELVSPSTVSESEYNMVLKFAESFLAHATISKDLDLDQDEFTTLLNS